MEIYTATVALRRTYVARLIAPRTATHHHLLAAVRLLATLHWGFAILGVIGAGPFQHIASHIVQAEFIAAEAAHRRGVDIAIAAFHRRPADEYLFAIQIGGIGIGATLVGILSPVTASNRAGANRVFPFAFGGEAVALSSLFGKPFGIGNRAFPIHMYHWAATAPPTTVFW